MASTTTNYGFNKPALTDEVPSTINALSTDMSSIDTELKSQADEDTNLGSRIDNLVLNNGDSSAEVIDARYSNETAVTHTTLQDRLDTMEAVGIDNQVDIETPTNLTETTETAEIIDIPSTAINGTLEGALKGNTVVNLLSDDVAGCESTSGWSNYQTVDTADSSNELEGTNCLKVELGAYTNGSLYRDVLSLVDITKYYLFSVFVKNADLTTGIRFGVDCIGDAGTIYSSYITGTTYTRVGVVLQPSQFDTASALRIQISLNGTAGQYGFADALMLQEITSAEYALGADALLDKYKYHRGMESTNYTRVKSVGKNLFNYRQAILGGYYDATGSWVPASGFYSSNFIKCSSSTEYCHNRGTNTYINYYDVAFNWISSDLGSSNYTTPSNCQYMKVMGSNTEKLPEEFQIELGVSITTFEEYKETTAYITPTLRSVPNETQDEFDVNEGIITKKIADSVAISSGTAVNTTNYTDAKNSSTFLIILDAGGTETGTVGTDNASGDGTLYYQLATPVITYYLPNTLQAYPSGTVYNESVVGDFGWYGSALVVSDTNYPISSLDYVNKVDPATGLTTPIPLSSCTIAGDGLSFTSTELADDDLVDYDYYYSSLSTIGDVVYSYNTNLKAQVNSNTDETVSLRGLIDRLNLMKVSNGGDTIFGDLGIGIAPSHPLHVSGDIVNEDTLNGIIYHVIKNLNDTAGQNRFSEVQLQSDNGGVIGAFKVGKDSSNYGSIQYGSGTLHDVLFLMNGVEKIKLDTSGDVIMQGDCDASSYSVGAVPGASGTFTTPDAKTVTFINGIITSMV